MKSRKLWQKLTAAALMTAAIAGASCAAKPFSLLLPDAAISADAAGTATLSGTTLTLKGNVVKEDVRAFADNPNVKKITAAAGTVLPEDCRGLFSGFTAQTIDLSKADTSNVTDMAYMFSGCTLTSLDLSGFDTSKVIYMNCMFADCENLVSLDVSHFNTKAVKYMGYMFDSCKKLKQLDLSSFSTPNVELMNAMFYHCESLTDLKFGDFCNSRLTLTEWMFMDCWSLKSLDLSTFHTPSLKDMSDMFTRCEALTSLNLSSFDTSKAEDLASMFEGCKSLTSLNLSSFNTSNVDNMGAMFYGCKSLTSLNLSSFNTSKIERIGNMFTDCQSLKKIYVSGQWDLSQLNYDYWMFEGCTSLVGGRGTVYSEDKTHAEYARIDKSGQPGYLTSQITKQPVSVTASVGETAQFKVTAVGSGLVYQWQYYNTTDKKWKNTVRDGCKTAVLSVPATTDRDGAKYRCIIKNKSGTKSVTGSVVLKVRPKIIAQPADVTASSGTTAKFTVKASGKKLTYQWEYRDGGDWRISSAAGSQTETASLTALGSRDGRQYRCKITSASGASVYTEPATLKVRPVISAQPADASAALGKTATFKVTASGKNLTYQWQYYNGSRWVNSQNPNAKTASIKVTATAARNGLQFRCVVKSGSGASRTSSAATLTVL